MQNPVKEISNLFLRIMLALAILALPFNVKGNCCMPVDTIENSSTKTEKKRNFILRCVDFVDNLLAQDTLYVSPNRFNLTVSPQYSYNYEYYRFATKEKGQSITLMPSSSHKVGLNFGWRWLALGYSFNLSKNQPEFDMSLNLYCSRAGLELYYRKRNDGYKIKSLTGFEKDGVPLTEYDRKFDGLTVTQGGVNAFYIFNYKKFSFPAAYSHSTNQRISAGSFILGASYNERVFLFDYTGIDKNVSSLMQPELKFQKVDYKDISINCGYSYNWVFAKDFLANITLSPTIGYKNTSLKFYKETSKEFLKNINFDLMSRLSIVYNNSRFYAGASLISHTYSYNKTSLSILNGIGQVNVYVGVNFWKRKR